MTNDAVHYINYYLILVITDTNLFQHSCRMLIIVYLTLLPCI